MTGTAPDDAAETRDDRIGLIHGAQVDLSMLATSPMATDGLIQRNSPII